MKKKETRPEVNPILRICLSNDGRKVWTTVLFLSTIMFQKVIQSCQFFSFLFFVLPYLQDHGLFRSRNFATIAT